MKKQRGHVVHDALLTQIGGIIVSFNQLEYRLKEIAGLLLLWDKMYPHMTDIVTSELSFQRTCSLVMSLALERFGDGANAEKFRGWVNECCALEQKRNDVAHCTWGGSDLTDGIYRKISRFKPTAKQKHGLRYVWEEMNESALRSVVDAIEKMTTELTLVVMELQEMVWPAMEGWSRRHVLERPDSPFPTLRSPGIQPKK